MGTSRQEGDARRIRGGRGFSTSDSRDERAAAGEPVAPAGRPVVDARGKAVITPSGFPLFL